MNSLLFAALTAAPEKIPDLKAARGAIPPGFWEAYGWIVVLLAGVACLVLSVVIHRLRRPKPAHVPSPGEIARQELAELRGQDDVAAAARVLRHFLIAQFRLAGPGLTAPEIAAHLPTDPALAAELGLFLGQCDVASFAPASSFSHEGMAVAEVERLIAAVERGTPPPLPLLVAR